MRHRKKKSILGRKRGPRKALMRALATNLVLYESIQTTEAKAKAMRPVVEKMVTRAKTDSVQVRRRLRRDLYVDNAVKKIVEELGPRYRDRNGGYLRIVKLAPRQGDGAAMARISFV